MGFFERAWDIFKHLDQYMAQGCSDLGPWLYVILFIVIFCETGLVVTPFLPGDSLLFAAGAVCTLPGCPLDPLLLGGTLIVAGVLGDAANYAIGKYVGPKIFHKDTGRWLNKRHLEQTHKFYEKYGGQTIIIARFAPIIRTFAPFVAGIGEMGYGRFALFNVTGAIAWVSAFIAAGWFFADQPFVKRNFQLVIIGIIVVSLIPVVWQFMKARKDAKAEKAAT